MSGIGFLGVLGDLSNLYSRCMGWAEEQLAALKPRYPDWDLWIVHVFKPRSVTWCAKPSGAPVATINASSPEALIAEIREQERV
jgi:hypothetical protein